MGLTWKMKTARMLGKIMDGKDDFYDRMVANNRDFHGVEPPNERTRDMVGEVKTLIETAAGLRGNLSHVDEPLDYFDALVEASHLKVQK